MNDLEKRVTDLENKVKILEETLETLKNMNLSEQMEGYIKKRSQALKMVNLLNAVSDQPALDFSKEEAQVKAIQSKKNNLDRLIAESIVETEHITEQYTDPDLFDYEVETGIETTTLYGKQIKRRLNYLSDFVGKGIRITAYKGFETGKIAIPASIEGKPVVSIGEEAFMNSPLSAIVLPKSIKAILSRAFYRCKSLSNITLPNDIEYLGTFCFVDTGLKSILIPENMHEISNTTFGWHVGSEKIVNVAFVSKDTKVSIFINGYSNFYGVSSVYCLPGSPVIQYARVNNIPMKPLSEFNVADYNT